MRPNATRRDHWAQLGIGAAALLLPPLALGAAFYSMLAAPDEEVKGPAAAQPPALPAAAGVEPAALQPPVGQGVEAVARAWNRLVAEGSVQTVPARTGPIQTGPVEVAATPAAAVIPPADPVAGGVTPPAADSPPVPPAPPKRTVHRPRQPQQDPYPLRTWLQQIGILPRNAKDTRG